MRAWKKWLHMHPFYTLPVFKPYVFHLLPDILVCGTDYLSAVHDLL